MSHLLPRLLPCLLALAFLAQPLRAAEAKPKVLPEKVSHGDSDPSYPAEAARRIEAGKALLDSGDLEGAWKEFELAERAESADPMSYFYRAVIAYRRGDFPLALRMAELGRDIANENVYRADQPVDEELTATAKRLTELHDTIKAKADANPGAGNAIALLRTADEAYASGLLAKAAAAYAEAFRAAPTRGEVGLKAATLYADRLKSPLEAARLWQQVLTAGEPHATTARAELQSHRDVLDAVLAAGLAQRDQWRSRSDTTEPLRLAEAFPESTELQIELALLFARKGPVETMIKHLQAASRLGHSVDDFLARKEFVDHLQQAGGLEAATGKAFASFVRDAYGEETLTTIRTELKRRADEIARLAREKAEKERQAKIAKELKELSTWRNAERAKAVAEVNALISARNDIEVEMAEVKPGKKQQPRGTSTRSTSFSFDGGKYWFLFTNRSDSHRRGLLPTEFVTRVSISSFAPLAQLEVWPSSWEFNDSRMRAGDDPVRFLPANPTYRALCKKVDFAWSTAPSIHTEVFSGGQLSYAIDYGNVSISVMLEDQEVARLRQLFGELAKGDSAGNNLEKLRQLRAK